jgi:hypothetical protein
MSAIKALKKQFRSETDKLARPMAGSLPPGNFAKLALYRKFGIRGIVECFENKGSYKVYLQQFDRGEVTRDETQNIRH